MARGGESMKKKQKNALIVRVSLSLLGLCYACHRKSEITRRIYEFAALQYKRRVACMTSELRSCQGALPFAHPSSRVVRVKTVCRVRFLRRLTGHFLYPG